MILESIPLSAAAQPHSEATQPANSFRARRGETPTPVAKGQSYARVAAKLGAANAPGPMAQTPSTNVAKDFSLWQDSAFGFGDLIDIVNPLQHVPIVATIYRNLTGDQIGMAPRMIGGALWGRIGGFISGVVNSVVEFFTGKDIGDHIYAKIWSAPDTSVKQNVATKSADQKVAAAKVPAQDVIAETAHGSARVFDVPLLLQPAVIHLNLNATTAADSRAESEGQVPRHIHNLPYRRNDDLDDPISGAGKLDLNA